MPAINSFELWLDRRIIALLWRMDEFVEGFERQKYYYTKKQCVDKRLIKIFFWNINDEETSVRSKKR